MYPFSSASQMCDPLPRTMNGGSPPTDLNARTGEFTPPGIMLSARSCRRRDCSVLRDVVVGIRSPRHGERRCQKSLQTQANTIAAPADLNSSDIHHSATTLQHLDSTVRSSSCPSNREGLKDSLGGSGLSFLLLRSIFCSFGQLNPNQGTTAFMGGTAALGRSVAPAPCPSPALETRVWFASPMLTIINSPQYNHPTMITVSKE